VGKLEKVLLDLAGRSKIHEQSRLTSFCSVYESVYTDISYITLSSHRFGTSVLVYNSLSVIVKFRNCVALNP